MSAVGRLPVVATVTVAVGSGALAAVASRDVAVSSGAVTSPALAWLVPVIVEGGAVTAGLLAWRRTAASLDARVERLVLAVLIALAVVVNASHAAGGSPLGVVLAATPPLVLVASVELLLRNHAIVDRPVRVRAPRRQAAAPAPVAKTAPSPVRVPTPPPVVAVASTPPPRRQGGTPGRAAEVAAAVEALVGEGLPVTGAAVGKRLGLSEA